MNRAVPFFIFTFILSIWIVIMVTGVTEVWAKNIAGRLVLAHGLVEYSLNRGDIWTPVTDKMYFVEGTMIRTAEKSEAAIILKDRSQIRMGEKSVLNLKTAGSSPGEKSLKRSVLDFIKGKLWFRNKRRTKKPLFETPVITGSIRGTELFLDVDEDGSTQFFVLEGRLLCENDLGRAVITRGEKVVTNRGSAPEVVKVLRPDDSVHWLLITPRLTGPGEVKAPDKAIAALDLLMKNQTSKAFALATQAVDENHDSASARVILATLYQKNGKFETGLKVARQALQLDPASAPALARCVELLLGLNDVTDAEKLMDGFSGDDGPVVRMLKGYIALIHHDPKGAKIQFQRAITFSPGFSEAYLGLGLAQYVMGESQKALKNLEYASLLNPLAAYPHNYLGKALLETGERHEAEAELLRAVELDPNDPTPHLYLAALQADSFRPGEAVKSYARAMELNNNRLVTRSSYLLDGDRAVKNINMAWSLGQLGLNNWASYVGDWAVWLDPSASGAYMFRSVKSIVTDDVDPATLGDTRREMLLKPVNANTYVTYSDYYSLLEKPALTLSIAGEAGSHETAGFDTTLYGGMNKTAYFSNLVYGYDGGDLGNHTDSSDLRGSASFKSDLSNGHEILGEILAGSIDKGDETLLQNGWLHPQNIESDTDYLSAMAGYHWRHGPRDDRHLLFMAQVQKKNFDSDENRNLEHLSISHPDRNALLHNETSHDSNSLRLDAAELFRISSHRFTLGGAWQTEDIQWKNRQNISFVSDSIPDQINKISGDYNMGEQKNYDYNMGEQRVYMRDVWFITPGLMLDMNMAWSKMHNVDKRKANGFKDINEWLPGLGFAWTFSKSNRLRAAWFREIQPDYLIGTLQPVETAGFKRITSILPGTYGDRSSVAWDCNWKKEMFTSVSLFRERKHYPKAFFPISSENAAWLDEDRNGLAVIYEAMIFSQMGISLTYDWMKISPDGIDGERIDQEIKTRLIWIHPSGLSFEIGLWYVDQDGKEALDLDGKKDDSFLLSDIMVKKSFNNKKVMVYLDVANLGDKKYCYLLRETVKNRVQLPAQTRTITVGCRVNF